MEMNYNSNTVLCSESLIDTRIKKDGIMNRNITLLLTLWLVLCVIGMEANKRKRREHKSKFCKVMNDKVDDIGKQFNCSKNRPKDLHQSLNVDTSLCPFYYKVDYDPDRYPAYLEQALPLSQYCLGSNHLFECVTVTKDIRVLKRSDCKDKFDNDVWSEETIRQVVGFTCEKRTVAISQTKKDNLNYM